MNDKINEEQKTSEEPEVKSDALTDDVLDDASGGAVFAKYDGVDGEAADGGHTGWIEVLSIGTPINEPATT
jgi:hypothetical protein